ncbi:MAG TPA: tRNA threonylcarbamoyladenosine dehydratase [Bacteroidetes bacterium]|nr:tRNA threonylcarbamoyladenosine dehydratase [Bacteroidota bacterium]
MWQSRTELLLGKDKLERLSSASVLIAGLGGVGAYAAEMLCRAGIGKMTLVDGDRIDKSNINRQLPAMNSTVGRYKTEVMAERLIDINPELKLHAINEFIRDDRMTEILEEGYDYVVDAIDTLSPKVFLIYHSMQKGIPIVCSMGAGGKVDPASIRIVDIEETFNCKLARTLRKRLRKLGIHRGFTAVFSPEEVPGRSIELTEGEMNKASNVGSISYMPAVFGCACASVVIRSLISRKQK